jgi:hypothetical protein
MIGYHNELKISLIDFIGKELETHQIKKIFHKSFPDINLNSILPGDHSDIGNKGYICPCCGTDNRLFDRVKHGRFKILCGEIHGETLSHTQIGNKGQGLIRNARFKAEVERRSMHVAEEWLKNHGYELENKSMFESFDFEARRDGEIIKIEVKGTTNMEPNQFFMTKNEVDLHQKESGKTGIIFVYSIQIEEKDGQYFGSAGTPDAIIGWNINDWELTPTQYRLSKK